MERANGPASLTSALLVRKGAALPAGVAAPSATVRALSPRANPTAGPRPARRTAAADPRTRISLRLDPTRHLRLKLAAAHLQQSLQDILIRALDVYLEQVGPAVMNGKCACLDGVCAARGEGCPQDPR